MKRGEILFVIGFIFLVFFSFLAFAGEIITFEANVFGPTLSVSVPDEIFIGNVSKGKETDKIRIDVNNTGNVAVTVIPELVNSSEEIFNYLYFARRTTEPYSKIGNWSLDIDEPSTDGGVESEYFYAKLDLRNFNGSINRDMMNHKADVKFIVVAR